MMQSELNAVFTARPSFAPQLAPGSLLILLLRVLTGTDTSSSAPGGEELRGRGVPASSASPAHPGDARRAVKHPRAQGEGWAYAGCA